jgi:uncharacterized Fe-S cluster-containing protein
MEDHKKVLSTQTLIEVEVKVLKPHLEVDPEARIVNINNMNVKLMEVDEETLKEEEVEEVEEVVKVVLEIIEVNNQISIQIITKLGHMAKNCYQKEHDARNGKLQ